jgi:hypothetical protein
MYSTLFEQMQKRNVAAVVDRMVPSGPCDGSEGFATLAPYLDECTSCHADGNASGRRPLETEAQWLAALDGAATLVRLGAMPPVTDAATRTEIARILACWSVNTSTAQAVCPAGTTQAEDGQCQSN